MAEYYNNSNWIGVRINNLNNNSSHNDFEGCTKIHEESGHWVWKTSIDSDFVVDWGTSILVSAARSNNSPFGGPLVAGEHRNVYYSIDNGATWQTAAIGDHINVGGSGFYITNNAENSSLVGLVFQGNPNLVGTFEFIVKVEMTYDDGTTPPQNYAGPEYFYFSIKGKQMLKGFIDTEKKTLFDGHQPYVFWFPGDGQSVGLNYSMTLWPVGTSETIDVALPQNDVFHLIDPEKLQNPDNLENLPDCFATLNEETSMEEITITGTRIGDSYVYPVYLCAKADSPGQFTHPVVIDGEAYMIGIDAYMEDENLYINLANFGVEIPDSIQKALYPNNVHEDKKDNILINRKFKELISQYWNILAGRGSYKSLINSLKWFEWGDLLELKEIWSRVGSGTPSMSVRDLTALLEKEYRDTLNVFKKTTYLAIYYALEKMMVTADGQFVYDVDLNPELEETARDWSVTDLSLKLAMLGAFYETFFMPIHLELLHCTITDVVFTPTFKKVTGSRHNRYDSVYDTYECECFVDNKHIKDGQPFVLHDVHTHTSWNTPFGWKWPLEWRDEYTTDEWDMWRLAGLDQFTQKIVDGDLKRIGRGLYKDVEIVGVDDPSSDYAELGQYVPEGIGPDDLYAEDDSTTSSEDNPYNNDLRNFYAQWYEGTGVVVPLVFRIKTPVDVYGAGSSEFVQGCKLYVAKCDDNMNVIKNIYRYSTCVFNAELSEDEQYWIVDCSDINLLFTTEGNWQLRFEFELSNGANAIKILNIKTIDISNATLNLYKVRPNVDGETYSNDVTDYLIRRQPFSPEYDEQSSTSYDDWIVSGAWTPKYYNVFLPHTTSGSIRKNNILIVDVGEAPPEISTLTDAMVGWYDLFIRYYIDETTEEVTSTPHYLVGVSKEFEFNPNDNATLRPLLAQYKEYIYRNDYGFFGWNHHMEPLGGETLADYIINPDEVVCVNPDIKYGHEIIDSEWEFKNVSKNISYKIKDINDDSDLTVRTPFVASNRTLATGFYDIIFKYRLVSDPTIERILVRNSAFKVQQKEPEPDPWLRTPLTFTCLEDGDFVVIPGTYTPSDKLPNIQFNKNNTGWIDVDWSDSIINLSGCTAGDIVQFRGENRIMSCYNETYDAYVNALNWSHTTGSWKVSGNIMSLIYPTGFETKDSMSNMCFYSLFYDMSGDSSVFLVDASELCLPAKTVKKSGYAGMFINCTSLKKAPELPAKTVGDYGYWDMFYNCTSLEKAPDLHAESVGEYGCDYMFSGCTSLVTAPTLPATKLKNYSYSGMFRGCTSLYYAPELPATVMAEYCYGEMFQGCTSLEKAPVLPATELATKCYWDMFANCTSLENVPDLPATELTDGCYGGMFYNCTSLEKAPVLPAKTLISLCYDYMFYGCTNLNYIKCLATNPEYSNTRNNWVTNVPVGGTFVKDRNTEWGVNQTTSSTEGGAPYGWTIQNA